MPLCPGGDVRRPGDDRLRLGGAVVELDELEFVGVRVLGDLEHPGDHHLVRLPDRSCVFGLDANAGGNRQSVTPLPPDDSSPAMVSRSTSAAGSAGSET